MQTDHVVYDLEIIHKKCRLVFISLVFIDFGLVICTIRITDICWNLMFHCYYNLHFQLKTLLMRLRDTWGLFFKLKSFSLLMEASAQKVKSWLGICHPWFYFWGLQRCWCTLKWLVFNLALSAEEEDRAGSSCLLPAWLQSKCRQQKESDLDLTFCLLVRSTK